MNGKTAKQVKGHLASDGKGKAYDEVENIIHFVILRQNVSILYIGMRQSS